MPSTLFIDDFLRGKERILHTLVFVLSLCFFFAPEIELGSHHQQREIMLESVRRIVPPLRQNMHKGQAGRIGVVGGSFEYTGAPFYAALSSLKAGADLAFVLCKEEAAVPIKSYSPEIIVMPVLSKNRIQEAVDLLPRLHALVIGPGLGREDEVFEAVSHLIKSAQDKEVPLVLDGDALFLLTKQPDLLGGYQKVILTPNVVEFSRLFKAVLPGEGFETPSQGFSKMDIEDEIGDWIENADSTDAPCSSAVRLARALGNVTILQKGEVDIIADGRRAAFCSAKGSGRRCGGQGDIMAGVSGLFLFWALNAMKDIEEEHPAILAAFAACTLTKRANALAFAQHKRSTTTPDIIEHIGAAFQETLESRGGSL